MFEVSKNQDSNKVLRPSLQLLAASSAALAVLNFSLPASSQTLESAQSGESAIAETLTQNSQGEPQSIPSTTPTLTFEQLTQNPIASAQTSASQPAQSPISAEDPAPQSPLALSQSSTRDSDQTNSQPTKTQTAQLQREPIPTLPEPPPGTSPVPPAVPGDQTPEPIIETNPPPTLETPIPSPAPGTTPAPAPIPGTTPTPTPGAPATEPAPQAPETKVLVSEVVVEGAEGELQRRVYEAISTRPGRTTTRSQLQEDINAIFATGFFANVTAQPSDTPLGVRVTFAVEPNPVLRDVQLSGNQVVSQEKVDEIFRPQYGRRLNLKDLQGGIRELNRFYQDQGYVLAQVIGAPQVSADGVVTLQVAEGVVENIDVRFLDKEDQPKDGKTHKYIVTRELRTKPGQILNRNALQRDVQRVFALGIFEDVQVALEPGEDPRQVDLVLNVKERKTGSLSAGAGFSSASGLFGQASYRESNFGGNNQDLNLEISVGQRELLFDASFTDPWIAGTQRLSYTVNAFNRLTRPFVFDNGPIDVNLPNGDDPRVNRLGGGVVFTQPLSPFTDPPSRGWTVSSGFQYQRVSIRDGSLDVTPRDELGNDLSFSGTGQDDLFLFQAAAVRDQRNNFLNPTKGSYLRFSTEQSAPIGSGSILLNRLRGSYSYYIPVKFTKFSDGPQALAFNVQAGTVLGDLPPYEAFSLGGSNTVRGYEEGGLGTGRSFVQATAEYRFPLFKIVGGALFLDAATTLGSQENVPGNPGGIRGKPGSGFGYGIGIRVKTPLGPVRVDYGFNDQGESRLNFGIGEKF